MIFHSAVSHNNVSKVVTTMVSVPRIQGFVKLVLFVLLVELVG